MNRQVKSYNGRNEETKVSDSKQQEARVEVKKGKLDQFYQVRRVQEYGSKSEQKNLHTKIQQDAYLQRAIQNERRAEETRSKLADD
jgi:hypothetical protein